MKLRESGLIAVHPCLHVMQETFVSMQWSPYTYDRIDLSRDLQNEHLGTVFQFCRTGGHPLRLSTIENVSLD